MATFRQRNGRWQAIIRRVDLKATKSFDRKVDAQSWARAKERDADLGHMPGRITGTLAPLIDRYEKELWPEKRWGVSKAYELTVLKRDLGAVALDTMTATKLLNYVRGLPKAGPSTRQNRLSYLKEVLRAARDLWGVPVPVDAVQDAITSGRRHGVLAKSGTRDRRPSADELANIIDFAKDREGDIDLETVVRVLSVMPLRLGELVKIGWDDEVKERRSVILRGRKHPDIREKEKPAEVPLIAFAGVDTFDLVFDRPRYMEAPFPYKPSSVSAAFTDTVLRLGIKDLHLHDLRAHAISSLFEAGMQIPMVALLSGHRNWRTLAKNYARIEPAAVHEALRRLT
jgi:integrase